jgi:hypothetical protein
VAADVRGALHGRIAGSTVDLLMHQEDGHVDVGVYLIAAATTLFSVVVIGAHGYIGILSLWGVIFAGFLVYEVFTETRNQRRRAPEAKPPANERLAAQKDAASLEEEEARAKRLFVLRGEADPDE